MARKQRSRDNWLADEIDRIEREINEMRRERIEARERRHHNGEAAPWTPPILMTEPDD